MQTSTGRRRRRTSGSFTSRQIELEHKRKKKIHHKGEWWHTVSSAAALCGVDKATIRKWGRRCPCLDRAIRTVTRAGIMSRAVTYYAERDLVLVKKELLTRPEAPPGMSYVQDVLVELGIKDERTLDRHLCEVGASVNKVPGKRANGSPLPRACVSTTAVDAIRNRLAAEPKRNRDDMTRADAAKELGCKREEVNGYVKAAQLSTRPGKILRPEDSAKAAHVAERNGALVSRREVERLKRQLAAAHQASEDRLPRAIEFLRGALAKEDRLGQELIAAAAEQGFSPGLLTRARRALGVRRTKRTVPGPDWWTLGRQTPDEIRVAKAKLFLQRFLATGPRPSKDVRTAAASKGINYPDLVAARLSLGVAIEGENRDGTRWKLPAAAVPGLGGAVLSECGGINTLHMEPLGRLTREDLDAAVRKGTDDVKRHVTAENRKGVDDMKSHVTSEATKLVDVVKEPHAPVDDAETVAVDDEDLRILRALQLHEPKLITQYTIVAESRVSRRTISDRLPQLIKLGLACQPKGPKSGAGITTKGKETIRRADRAKNAQ